MGTRRAYLNTVVAALALGTGLSGPAWAQGTAPDAPAAPGATMPAPDAGVPMAELLKQLKSDDPSVWRKAESDILRAWSKSGSASMDLLLKRGRDALDDDKPEVAIEHLTALIDHAPDFAEAYNARAEAYYEVGLFGPAVADIAMALKLNPKQFGALAGLGLILEQVGDKTKALGAYKASAAINPHQPAVNRAIARLQRAAGEEL